MIINFNEYIKENLKNKEHEVIIHYLHEVFSKFQNDESYLKHLSYSIRLNDYVLFEIDINWFYNDNDYEVIYTLTKQGFNLSIQDFITNHKSYDSFGNFNNIINKICYQYIPKYLDYHYYPNLTKIIKNNMIVLDYDKFLIEFEEELVLSKSIELYNSIDNFNTILEYKNKEEIKEIQSYFKSKYEYILNSSKFDLI